MSALIQIEAVDDRLAEVRPPEGGAAARFLRGPDEETFRDLFREMAPRVLCYFRARGCDRQTAEDLTQEAMLAVFRQAGTLRNHAAFRAWMFKIVRNVHLQFVRRAGREIATVAMESERREPAPSVSSPWADTRFAEWISVLDPEEAHILTLRFVEGLEYHEIAEVLGMPLGTVQWKIFRAKRQLAARFGNGGM